jgi:FkbM family methyltransferase
MGRLVSKQSSDIINAHTARNKGSGLFIDMGSNLGQGFQFFSSYYDPNLFDYWFVEPNPFCLEALEKNVSALYDSHGWKGNREIINAAVSNTDGTASLFGLVEDTRGKTSDGASVIKDHNSAFYASNEARALKVKSVKASSLIEDAAKKYPTIVVKMDIESAEYDALEDLIGTAAIDRIAHLYVEWHSQYFSADKAGESIDRERKIKELLSGKLTDWR